MWTRYARYYILPRKELESDVFGDQFGSIVVIGFAGESFQVITNDSVTSSESSRCFMESVRGKSVFRGGNIA